MTQAYIDSARQFLAVIHVPLGKEIRALIYAFDPNPTVFVHFTPFQGDGGTPYGDWAERADLRIEVGSSNFGMHTLLEAVTKVWPDRLGNNAISVYDGRCTCCCEGVQKIG